MMRWRLFWQTAVVCPVWLALAALPCTSEVVIYSEPGDLSGCDNLRRSTRYEVTINGNGAFVYESQNTKQPDPRIMGAHFCIFSFKDEPVTVEIANLQGDIASAQISPHRLQTPHTIDGNRLSFVMQQPRKHYIKINNEPYPLLILADEPDTNIPAPGPDVQVFEPGHHDLGRDSYIMESNKEIYLKGGAVVEATLKASGSLSNFRLRGRGIVYAGDYPWTHDGEPWNMGIFHTSRLSNSVLEGVMFLDSPYWNLGIANENCEFRNLTIVGWHHNTDGIWVGPNSQVSNCLIINNDDSVRPLSTIGYTDNSTTLVEDVMIYNMAWGGAFKILANPLAWCPNPIQNMTFRTIDILHSEAWGDGDGGFLFIGQGNGDRNDIRNLTWENVWVESFTGKLFNIATASTSSISNLTFRNLTTNSLSGELLGRSGSESIDGVSFVNLQVGGQLISSWSESGLSKNQYVYNVDFSVDHATENLPHRQRCEPPRHNASRGGPESGSLWFDLRGCRITPSASATASAVLIAEQLRRGGAGAGRRLRLLGPDQTR